MDTKPLELEAKNYIGNRLFRAGFLIADPQFDTQGSDLLIFKELNSQIKLLIIQSKGRTVNSTKKNNVRIKKEYVQNHFVVFVYVKHEEKIDDYFLYCYFKEDVEKWPLKNDEYILYIPSNFYEKAEFIQFIYSDDSKSKIESLLLSDNSGIEYIQALSFGQKLLIMWQSEGSIPSLDNLAELFMKSSSSISSLDEAVLIMISSYMREEQHEQNHDDYPEYSSFEYLLGSIAKHANTTQEIVETETVISCSQISVGSAIWYGPFNKYTVARFILKRGKNETEGIYALISDSEGEGIEMFLPRIDILPPLIRTIPKESRAYSNKIAGILFEK